MRLKKKSGSKSKNMICLNCAKTIPTFYKYCIYCGEPTNISLSFADNDADRMKRYHEAKSMALSFYQLKDKIKDDNVRKKIYTLSVLSQKLFDAIDKNPDQLKKSEVRSLINVYIPNINNLINNYIELQQDNVSSPMFKKLQKDILGTLDTINFGIRGIHERLYDDKILDISADMEVLENLFKEDM